MGTPLTLTAKQQRFIAEYLVDGNGARAAIAAGYGRAGARVRAHRLTRDNAAVQAEIARLPSQAHTWWAQTLPLDIQIDDSLVEVHFNVMAACPALRALRAQHLARGVRWQKRYVKHARIELVGEGDAPLHPAAVEPLAFDLRLQATRRPLRATTCASRCCARACRCRACPSNYAVTQASRASGVPAMANAW
jgi:hypothetical protein